MPGYKIAKDEYKLHIKPCPFCGSTDIRFSAKTCSTKRYEYKYHVAMYCNKCNCYGARDIINISKDDFRNSYGREDATSKYGLNLAIAKWNQRV